MEKVLITGATGFVGKNLITKLTKKYKVYALIRNRSKINLLPRSNNLIEYYATLTNYSRIRKIVAEILPNYTIHLATDFTGIYSYKNYAESLKINFLATVNLIEACRTNATDFKQFISAGSSDQYGYVSNLYEKNIKETTPENPNNPYAISKSATELYLKYLYRTYKFPYTFIIPFNTYGRKDNYKFFIESTIMQMLHKEKVFLGNPNITRDWVYIDDHVDAYLKTLGNKKAIGKTINICTGKGTTTKKISEITAKLTKFNGKIYWNSFTPRLIESTVIIGNNQLAKEIIKWQPKYNINKGIKATIKKIRMKALGSRSETSLHFS